MPQNELNVETYDATATPKDILEGKVAYARGKEIVGTIKSKQGDTFIPGKSSQILCPKWQYVISDISVAGDANLKAENIKNGVTIFGVKGTSKGTPSPDKLPNGFYKINVNSIPEGAGENSSGGIASHGANITISTEPSDRIYEFSQWEENNAILSTDKEYSFLVKSNRNLIAKFNVLPHYSIIVIISPDDAGNVSGFGNYFKGESVTLVATTDLINSSFIGWEENGQIISNESTYTFTVGGNRVLTAKFNVIPIYTITAISNPLAGGDITGAGRYMQDENVSLVATASSSYKFLNWSESGETVNSDSNYIFVASKDRHLIANFNEKVKVQIGTKPVGNIVKLNVDGVPKDFIVIHQGLPSTRYDESCNGTWLLMNDFYGTIIYSEENINSYDTSDVNEYLNNEFLTLFDLYTTQNIKQVKIPYTKGNTVMSGSDGLLVSSFLLSPQELCNNRYAQGEGSALPFFLSGNNNLDSSWWNAHIWLTRTKYLSNSNGVWAVTGKNYYNSLVNCNSATYFRPAIIVNSTMLVPED